MESIHGHEVLQMMMESGESYTTESLAKAINDKFGKEARFHTCSSVEMSAEDLIEFLSKKGKFTPSEDGFTTGKDKMCSHH